MKKEIKKENIFSGAISMQDEISPAYINLKNPKYIEIDNMYYAGLIVVNYYREQEDLILKSLMLGLTLTRVIKIGKI